MSTGVTAATPPQPATGRSGRGRWVVLAVVLAVVAGAVAVLGSGIGSDPSQLPARFLGQQAPPLAGTTLDGDHFDLRAQHGSVVLVNVWASWCGPCRREQPLLSEAARALRPRGLVVVGVNTQDTPAAARAFLAEFGGAAYPSIDDSAGRLAVQWGTFGVPETFVVDSSGVVRAKATGEVTAAWIEQEVVPLLGR